MNNSTAFNPKQYYNNTSRDAAFEVSTSSRPDSFSNIIMNSSFVILPASVDILNVENVIIENVDLNLSRCDFDLLESIILNPPKPNESLQKLFSI